MVFVALRHPYIVLLLIKIHLGRTFNTPNDTGTIHIRLSKELRAPLKLQARGSLTHTLAYELVLSLNTRDCDMQSSNKSAVPLFYVIVFLHFTNIVDYMYTNIPYFPNVNQKSLTARINSCLYV